MRVEGRGAKFWLHVREEGLQQDWFKFSYISKNDHYLGLFVCHLGSSDQHIRLTDYHLRLTDHHLRLTWLSSQVDCASSQHLRLSDHLCTGEAGRGESSTEGEERPLPSRQAALSAIWRSEICNALSFLGNHGKEVCEVTLYYKAIFTQPDIIW